MRVLWGGGVVETVVCTHIHGNIWTYPQHGGNLRNAVCPTSAPARFDYHLYNIFKPRLGVCASSSYRSYTIVADCMHCFVADWMKLYCDTVEVWVHFVHGDMRRNEDGYFWKISIGLVMIRWNWIIFYRISWSPRKPRYVWSVAFQSMRVCLAFHSWICVFLAYHARKLRKTIQYREKGKKLWLAFIHVR